MAKVHVIFVSLFVRHVSMICFTSASQVTGSWLIFKSSARLIVLRHLGVLADGVPFTISFS